MGLSPEEPGPRLLQRLFDRFNAVVPFETASKILRDAEVAPPEEKPRGPALFWADHLGWGSGGTCFARVAAFGALVSSLGFSARKVLGRVERDFDHAALLVAAQGEELLADVGFPLPALLPMREAEAETPLMALATSRTERGFRVGFSGGVPDGPRGLEIFLARVPEEEFAERWRKTFRPDSRFLKQVSLRLQEEGRVLSFTRGELRVDDLHSRLRLPLASPRPAALQEIFGTDRDHLARALAIVGDPEPEISDAMLTVYLETDALPEKAFATIASPAAYRGLMEGVAEVIGEEADGETWTVNLRAPRAEGSPEAADARFSERIVPDPAARRLAVRRSYADRAYDSSYAVEERGGEIYLVRSVALTGPRQDLLRNDSARGRMAGTLAVDLLAWARRIGRRD